MAGFINIFKAIFKAGITPAILVAVWIFDIRPLTKLIPILDGLLAADLSKEIEEREIPIAIIGVIDVALLTFVYNLITIFLSRLFSHPAIISLGIKSISTKENYTSIPFNEENIGNQEKVNVYVTGELEVKSFFWLFQNVLKGMRLSVIWHPRWLSVSPEIRDSNKITEIYEKPGELYFNLMDFVSVGDKSTSINCLLSISANSDLKRNGYLITKIGVNSKYKFVRFLFDWFIKMIVKADFKPCKISLEKGS